MRDEDAGLIPVVKQTTIVGTVTDRDSTIRVAVGAERSPEAATIDLKQGLGGTTRRSSRAHPRRKQAVRTECQPRQLSYFRV
jgi:hypothetical protein